MCGIYACRGNELATTKVFDGLKRIEYRGYDSWGITVLENNQLLTQKQVGKISALSAINLPKSKWALGHTRWATHGGVTDYNAHPHQSPRGDFALVHNGVLENYEQLKKALGKKGYQFQTETDTEVIVGLISTYCKNKLTSTKLQQLFAKLSGRNTLCILEKNGRIWAYRQGSPLLLGVNKQKNLFCSSDLVSLSHDADRYYALQHGELVSLEGDVIKSNMHKAITWKDIDVHSMLLDKGEYSHFMLKEIYEQPETLVSTLHYQQALFPKIVQLVRTARNIYVVGAGSASYAALNCQKQLLRCRENVHHVPSYDCDDLAPLFTKNDLAIVLSQSGETADTISAVEKLQKKSVAILSVVNMPSSSLTNMATLNYPLNVGAEVGVASTKALTAHFLFGMALAAHLKGQQNTFDKEVRQYCGELEKWLQDDHVQKKLRQQAQALSTQSDIYILGKGDLLSSTLEAALKIKEVSYVHAEGFSAGELKHGVIALIQPGAPVVCLIADDHHKADLLSSAHEVKARGARVIGLAAQDESIFDEHIPLPKNQTFITISSIIAAQLLAYEMAIHKQVDPDKPRNLAKSVTVK